MHNLYSTYNIIHLMLGNNVSGFSEYKQRLAVGPWPVDIIGRVQWDASNIKITFSYFHSNILNTLMSSAAYHSVISQL